MNHLGTKQLETQRLILRRFELSDAEAMFRNWARDDEVTRFLMWPSHKDIGVSEIILKEWIAKYDDKKFYQWAIVPKSNPDGSTGSEPIGSISIVDMDEKSGLVHVGYCIGRKWWHQGITSEALSELLSFFFKEVGVNRIEARHDPRNPNSGKVMTKCGLRYEGTIKQGDWNNQGVCDYSIYGLVREDYEKDIKADSEFVNVANPNSTVSFDDLYDIAIDTVNDRKISRSSWAGSVAAAILTDKGNIYKGVCIDTPSSLGFCAEHAAIAAMITAGETRIVKLVAVLGDTKKAGAPCGRCREFIVQINDENYKCQVMLDGRKIVTIDELLPYRWN